MPRIPTQLRDPERFHESQDTGKSQNPEDSDIGDHQKELKPMVSECISPRWLNAELEDHIDDKHADKCDIECIWDDCVWIRHTPEEEAEPDDADEIHKMVPRERDRTERLLANSPHGPGALLHWFAFVLEGG